MVAGEPSGDRHGADLVRAIRAVLPGVEIWGMGGDEMARAGVNLHVHMADLAVVGLVEALGHLGAAVRARASLIKALTSKPPSLAILIDFPEFNLWLARGLRRHGVPLLYYISPQVWAWRPRRVKLMARLLDRIAVILPFEESLLRGAGIAADYVGHPLVEQVDRACSSEEARRSLDLPRPDPIIGLLPGSRPREVEATLPLMLEGVEAAGDSLGGSQIVVAVSPLVSCDRVHEILKQCSLPASAILGQTHQVIRASRVVLVASGTATLETAFLQTPMVVVYRTSWLSYILGRRLIKVKHISLANILAGEEVVPELIQGDFAPQNIKEQILRLWHNEEDRERMISGLQEVGASLGQESASLNTAQIVLEMLSCGTANGSLTP
jgi:lipid-A-disaccharide synthase